MRIAFLSILILALLSSCKSSELLGKYNRLDDLCMKIQFFEKKLNTKRKQYRNHESFEIIISDIESQTNINTIAMKGFGGISYLNNEQIREDIKKWKDFACK